MNKLKDFLEKNIQWLAIGAGALYLIWMVYSFVLTNTAWQVPVGGEARSPGEVDEAVEQIATQLDDKIKHGPKIEIKVPNFQTAVDLKPQPMPGFDLAWANSPTQDVTLPAAPGTTPNPGADHVAGGGAPAVPGAGKVVELPKVPAATDLAANSGRSNVLIPTPAPAIAAGGDPNAAPAPQQATPAANGTDIDWVSVAYKIPIDALAKEFQRTNIPAQQQQGATCFLDVELVREELQPDGSWGPPTVCPKLTTSTEPPGGVPADTAGRQALQQYENWAVSAIVELLQPKFYDWAKGDQWALSKDYVGNGIVGDNGAPLILGPNDVRPGFDPNQFVNLDPKMQQQVQQQMAAMQPPLTNAEKRLISGARQKAIQQRAAENTRSRGPANRGPTGGGPGIGGPGVGGPGRGGPGGQGGYAPEDNLRPGGRSPGFAPPPVPGYPPMGGGEMGDAMGAGPAQQQQANYSQMFPLPQQGKFDPRVLVAGAANPNGGPQVNMSNIVGWATDWKAEPGKTYRYMIRYKIENPIWATINVAKNKKDADVFALASADSAWTEPVQAKNILEFFITSANSFGRPTATVTVFKYENGTEHKAVFTNVQPGDTIGVEKDGIDYSTGYTLVDLRPDLTKSDRTIAWIITPESQLTNRDIRKDSESPLRLKLEQEVQAATPAAAAAAVGPGGAPAMINPTR